MMALCVLLLSTVIQTTISATTAEPEASPPRSCAAPSVVTKQDLIAPAGVDPYAVHEISNATECCSLCAANASGCGAFYAKITTKARGSTIADGGDKSCKLFSTAAAGRLTKGSCKQFPHGTPHNCTSSVYVTPGPTPPPTLPPTYAPRPDVVELSVNATSSWTISPYLASMSLVYQWAPDEMYNTSQNGSITKWAKKNHLNIARYPAGQSSLWNWEAPSGWMGISSFNPKAPAPAPAKDWMSMTEYLDFCHEIGSQPLIGVNYMCGNNHKQCDIPANESIANAVKQVEFTVAHGFPGAFYYIGNEECQVNCVGFHADLIARHAVAMKAADPTIKTMFSSNEIRPHILEQVMKQVGVGLLDGVDLHGKWPEGGGGSAQSFAKYILEVPLLDHKVDETWRSRLAGLRNVTTTLGRPDFLLMNNEFGVGHSSSFRGNWSRYQMSMALIEFNLELHVAGFDVACMWDNGPGYPTPPTTPGGPIGWHCANCDDGVSDHMLLSGMDEHTKQQLPIDQYRFNPVAIGMELLSSAQNQSMLKVATTGYRLHGFAGRDEKTKTMQLWLMNKYDGTPQKVKLTLPLGLGWGLTTITTLLDDEADDVPLASRWGSTTTTPLTCVSGVCEFVLPPLSFSKLS